MKPQNQEDQKESLPKNQSEDKNQIDIPITPLRNRTIWSQATTASHIELTPLVSPAKLRGNSLFTVPFSRMEDIQTPRAHRNNSMIPLFGQNSLVDRNNDYFPSHMLFGTQECDQFSNTPVDQEQSESEKDNQQENHDEDTDSKEFQSENQEIKPQSSSCDFRRPAVDLLEQSKEKKDESKKMVCHCKKTKCLKLYCDCFSLGVSCGPECECQGCHNSEEYEHERVNVKLLLKKRNSEAFQPKIENNEHTKGCNCKKSACQKKYCECFQANLECGSHCKCEQCKNGKESKQDSNEGRFNYTAKKERRMQEL